jgi:tetratricopeptide (TPR) repeat protein
MSLNKSKSLRTAEKYVLQGKIPSAIDEYRKVVDADPTDLTAINTLGDLYVRAGRIQDAIANFSRIADSYREGGFILKAIAMLKKISKLDPTNVDTAMKLANLYSQQGLLVEARQQYLQVADAYARSGQTRKALEAYQKIADLDPSNTSVRMKLGEIYAREGMKDQAHDALLMAGAEFLRKGDTEQALNANLKAIAIEPESRQALTAIASIYTQLGQADRAINILCDAFEANPGDVELLTILGRTYLSAGLMDDAERTFLSLVELDRNRYNYLLEVGRRFLQMGELDRAAEQIDGCLDVLIIKREEDKAIDFLRRILDRDTNHLGSLKRLSQIFLRIREDHNLIASLNSLAEAAMRKGDEQEAIAALKELARLDPDEPMHLQRLFNLGVRDIAEPDSPDVVRATGPLDYQSAAFDDAFVIRQISEAEILAGHGQVTHAVGMLNEILTHTPENVQVHLKLKDIYLRAGMIEKAAAECVELARIYELRGETARASDFVAEAHQLDPRLAVKPEREPEPPQSPFGFESELAGRSEGGFEVRPATGGFDLNQYRTGPLSDQSGFVTLPGDGGFDLFSGPEAGQPTPGGVGAREGTPTGSSPTPVAAQSNDSLFASAGDLPSDTMSRILRDELEGIDFYIAQGYLDIARDTLDRLREEHGDHSEIRARYERLGGQKHESQADFEFQREPEASAEATPAPSESFTPDFRVDVGASPKESEHKNALPFLINKESGPLQSDLLVHLNTSELLRSTDFDAWRGPAGGGEPQSDSGPLNPPFGRIGTSELIDSFMSGIDASLETSRGEAELQAAQQPFVEPDDTSASADLITAPSPEEYTTGPLEAEPEAGAAESVEDELQRMLEDLKGNTGDLQQLIDYETHYNLGLAYKDMDLHDEAIEQFQMAFRLAAIEDNQDHYFQCCHMLGVCFKRKAMPKVAVMWFDRGIRVPGRAEDEYQALRYEIGLCYEEMGETDKAIDVFMQVFGVDVNYREVGEKIRELQAAKNA